MVVPAWRLRVVDESGTLVRDIKVTEHWQHYLVETEGHEEVRQTDQSGHVDFPERTVRASFMTRVLGILSRFTALGTPRKSGPYASLVVWGNRDYVTEVAGYQPDLPLPNQVVVHRPR